SPDGTQIAYLTEDDDWVHVWVANVDGTDAHEILAEQSTALRGLSGGPAWSPVGGRPGGGGGGYKGSDGLPIYTFAPDGSDFTKVITDGISPYWSPDGSQIAYTIPCDDHPNAFFPEDSTL